MAASTTVLGVYHRQHAPGIREEVKGLKLMYCNINQQIGAQYLQCANLSGLIIKPVVHAYCCTHSLLELGVLGCVLIGIIFYTRMEKSVT